MNRNAGQGKVWWLSLSVAMTMLMMVAASAGAAMKDLPDFTELVEQSSPAVVNISTTTKVKQEQFRSPHGEAMPDQPPIDDFLRRFFGDRGGEGGGAEEFDEKSLGSGFVISKDGYVLTNNHVIRDADEIVVRLSDRREFVAEVVGSDKNSDVALLKIDADNLPVVKIGSSAALKVGGWVLAIGSPFGFEHSVTAGIVSAKGRSLPNENYVPFIQTDVAINPGNSGGPLFNMDGEVVGVNSQIFSRTGGFMGLSFAIPIDIAMSVVDQLRSAGHVTRGWLGILIQDVDRTLAESFGMTKPIGALVARVLPDSPAQKAGIEVGDVIVEFDGKEVESSGGLPPMVGVSKVGEKVPLKVIRKGKPLTLKVTISELPEEDQIDLASGSDDSSTRIKRLAIMVADLTPEQKQELDGKNGILVESTESGPASKAGIRRGDVILQFNNVDVGTVDQFKKLVADLPAGKAVPILVQRRGSPIFLALKLEEDAKQ
ncbi:MAG: DegQ family serine endoprotease [Gammaproteobacteria bacterium]|nr:DegQ family serine endoprotease [Gammaproteobacteria bacterium]